jgi:hypothetical protein
MFSRWHGIGVHSAISQKGRGSRRISAPQNWLGQSTAVFKSYQKCINMLDNQGYIYQKNITYGGIWSHNYS